MTCSDRERDLALYAGGDSEDGTLARHVETCPRCREYVDSMRTLLAGMTPDTVPAAPPIAAAVMRTIRRRRYSLAALAVTAAAATVLIAAGVSMLMRPVAIIAIAPPAPAGAIVTAEPLRSTPKTHSVKHHRAKTATPAEPVVVKLVTDDPNVVIYWITD
jgi:hypothetical protein